MSSDLYDWAYDRLLIELGHEPTEDDVVNYIAEHEEHFYWLHS